MHSSAAESFSLEAQEAEENFDLALIGALEIDVVPHLGDTRIPDSLVSQLARVLHQGSQLYESDPESEDSRSASPALPDTLTTGKVVTRKSRGSQEYEKVRLEREYDLGSTDSGSLVPRERFSYWCFDLLFLICSNTTKGSFIKLFTLLAPNHNN
jgi:hypothetical protein